MSITDREFAELLRSNPELGFEGDLIAATDSSPQSSTNAAYIQESITCEHDLQAAVITECDKRSILRPEWGLIFAIPNGGHRHPAVAAKLKSEGVKDGVLDLFLPVARHGYHGFFIELKWHENKPSQKQQEWIRNLKAEGYLCHVVWDEATEVIGLLEWYLEKN